MKGKLSKEDIYILASSLYPLNIAGKSGSASMRRLLQHPLYWCTRWILNSMLYINVQSRFGSSVRCPIATKPSQVVEVPARAFSFALTFGPEEPKFVSLL